MLQLFSRNVIEGIFEHLTSTKLDAYFLIENRLTERLGMNSEFPANHLLEKGWSTTSEIHGILQRKGV